MYKKIKRKIFTALKCRHFFDFLPDKIYLKLMYHVLMDRKLDLKNPQTFNEKLQWLKLYNRKPLYTTMVDKYEVKSYVSSIIGSEYIIKTLGIYENFDDIDFSKLPDRFVIKCTHDSGGVVICKDKSKFDISKARKKINECLKSNFYFMGREWPYKNVKPRIIIEEFLDNHDNHDLNDYKFMCFNGKFKCSFVCTERRSDDGLKVTFFDKNWNVMPFERHYPKSKKKIEKPKNYNKMIELSEKLAKNIPFVRIDFYEVEGKIYFGEITFFPGNGTEEFTPEKYDYLLGSWIKLPKVKNEK